MHGKGKKTTTRDLFFPLMRRTACMLFNKHRSEDGGMEEEWDKKVGLIKKKKGKPVATDRTQDSYQSRGWGQK